MRPSALLSIATGSRRPSWRRPERLLVPLMSLAVLSGCATVKSTRLREDYAQVDRQRVKRIVVVTSPIPEGGPKVADLFGLITKRDLNLKRNFLVRDAVSSESMQGWKERCQNGLEGVLHLSPTLQRKGEKVEARLQSTLLRCHDGEEVWSAKAEGDWKTSEPHVKEVSSQYVSELGPEVEPYVPAAFYIVRATIEEMPNPVLNDEDISEKIELGD